MSLPKSMEWPKCNICGLPLEYEECSIQQYGDASPIKKITGFKCRKHGFFKPIENKK